MPRIGNGCRTSVVRTVRGLFSAPIRLTNGVQNEEHSGHSMANHGCVRSSDGWGVNEGKAGARCGIRDTVLHVVHASAAALSRRSERENAPSPVFGERAQDSLGKGAERLNARRDPA